MANGAAACHICRRPTGWLGSRMTRSMYASGSSRVAAAPAAPRHLHGWPLPGGGQRPAVFHRVRSSCDRAADRKPRAVTFDIRFTCTTIRYSAATLRAGAEPKKMDDPEVVRAALEQSGLNAAPLLARTQEPAVKERLLKNTKASVARGAFGSPTFFVVAKYSSARMSLWLGQPECLTTFGWPLNLSDHCAALQHNRHRRRRLFV